MKEELYNISTIYLSDNSCGLVIKIYFLSNAFKRGSSHGKYYKILKYYSNLHSERKMVLCRESKIMNFYF